MLRAVAPLLLIFCISSHHVTSYPDEWKFDCHPDQQATEREMINNCAARGCIWDPLNAEPGTPACYYPENYTNYRLYEISENTLILRKTDTPSGFIKDVTKLKIEVIEVDDDRLRIRITDNERTRFEPPLPVLNVAPGSNHSTGNKQYAVAIETGPRLKLSVSRKSTGAVIFETDLSKLVYSNQFIQMIFNVTTKTLYGLGEHLETHTKTVDQEKDRRLRFRLLNHDDSDNPDMSSYGSHPFFMMYEEDQSDNAHGFLLHSSSPMDMVFTHTPALSVRAIGGILDFFLFLGPSPLDVMRQKQSLLGPAPMPPFWSLGFHLCRFGYQSSDELRNTYQENIDAGIPLDGQWADIDYMHKFNMFSYDMDKFGNLPDVVRQIHRDGRYFVPILDPAVSPDQPEGSVEHDVFMDGLANNVYVLNTSSQLVKTRVWNEGYSVYPDFTNPNTSIWWKKNLKKFHDKIPFDGLWIDMNEPSAIDFFGQEGGCPTNNTLDRPQFNPVHPTDLIHKTICMSSRHHLGDHYDFHNLYAFYESRMAYEFLAASLNKRPFLLSRATTTGQHVYSSHWAGDIASRWDWFKLTISGVLSSNIFGYPLVGADICGFGGEASDELCARWSSVGAFYSFARNHNDHGTRRQDPASRPGVVLEAAKENLLIRYSLLPFLYTLFYQNNQNGSPVLRSLKMNYPSDSGTHGNDVQFMWGTDLMISPIVDMGQTNLDAYFPPGTWYDHQDKRIVANSTEGHVVMLHLELTEVGLHWRSGSVIPTQDPATSTRVQRLKPFNLVAYLDGSGSAIGQLYWDDGESIDSITFGDYTLVDFEINNKRLIARVKNGGFTGDSVRVQKITIVTDWSKHQQQPLVTFKDKKMEKIFTKVKFSDKILDVQEEDGIVMSLLEDFEVSWT